MESKEENAGKETSLREKRNDWFRFSPGDLLTRDDYMEINRLAGRIALIYAGLGFLWIFLSDWIVADRTFSSQQLFWISLGKGTGYIFLTGILLFFLIRHFMLNGRRKYAELHLISKFQERLVKAKTDDLLEANQNMRLQMRANEEAKEKLSLFNEQLEQEVKHRTNQLNKTIGELEWKIEQSQEMEEALKCSEELYRLAVEEAPIPVVIHQEDGTIVAVSRVWFQRTGYDKRDFTNVLQLIRKMGGNEINGLLSHNSLSYQLGHRQYDGSVKMKTKQGEEQIWDLYSSYVGKTKAGQALAMTVGIDVTKRIRQEQEVNYLSYHDALTGLYNRRHFENVIQEMDRQQCYPLSIIVGDVNGLKLTNDVFGHIEGDRLLKRIARILTEAVGPDDVVARWGGDEFILLLPCCEMDRADKVCETIRKECSGQKQGNLTLSISLGMDTKQESGEDIQGVLRSAESHMYEEKLRESSHIRRTIIQSIREILREKPFQSEVQSKRIADLTRQIGLAMGLSEIKLAEIDMLAMLHDIGEITIQNQVLEKKEQLSPDELQDIQRHPEIGYRIAQSAPELGMIAEYILTHHEHWDGTGYPQGLKGRDIPLLARILAVVDAYQAMTSDRPYRPALTEEQAREELKRNAGTQFDPDIVDTFLFKVLGESEN